MTEEKENTPSIDLETAARQMLELSNVSSFASSGGSSSSEVSIEDIYEYLTNPEENIKEIRDTSAYLTAKHGVLKDVLRMVKSLPTLKYSLSWSGTSDTSTTDEQEQLAQDFLSTIDVTQVLRDGLYETGEVGTVVTCLRLKKYVQFLDVNDLVIDRQKDGKWVIDFDLQSLDTISDDDDRLEKIESLPDEVTIAAYDSFKSSNDEDLRFVEIKNCHVVNLDAKRNSPFGYPITMGAWLPILQKEMIDKVEQSVSDRLIKQILVLSADWLDKEETKPVPRDVLARYFREVTDLLQGSGGGGRPGSGRSGSNNSTGTGTIMLPHFLSLDALKIDTTMFKRELYDKINDDIYANLGASESLISGKGGNYSSANVNSEKFFSFIFTIVEQFESVINDYLKLVMPKDVSCKINFDRSTVLDKKSDIERKKELYMQTSVLKPYVEAVMDAPLNEIVAQRKREQEMGLEDLFFPAKNAYTSSDKDSTSTTVDNENTEKTRSSNGNENPSPSDK